MQLVLTNLTAVAKSYASGAVTLAGTVGATTSVTAPFLQLALATDGNLRSDVVLNNVVVGDNVNTFGASDGLNYLLSVTQNIGPNSDGLGNNLTSTTVSSKQALDVNVTASVPPSNILSTGTLTGTGQTVTLILQGTASVNVDVSGSGFVGSLVVIENTPSQSRVLGVFNGNTSPIAGSITANGNYRVVGLATSSTITVQFTSYTSGSATINIYGSTAPFIMMPYSANAANVLVTSYLNDGVGNALTSTTINSKQRLDVGTASEGLDGSTAPFWAIAAGGKDGSGNLQTFLTDTLGNLAILNKDASGNSINSQSNALNVNTKTPIIYSAPTTASVGTTSTLILASNTNRLGLYLSNTSTQQISLGFSGNAAVYQNGITLYPGEKFWMDEYSFSTGAVYAVTTGAGTYIGVQEIT